MKHDLDGAELKIQINTHLPCEAFYEYLLTKFNLLNKFDRQLNKVILQRSHESLKNDDYICFYFIRFDFPHFFKYSSDYL